MWHDTRQAFRVLTQHKLFAATAILVLALGMALNAATFSVVYALLYAPLPVHEPGALVSIYTSLRGQPDRPTILLDDVRELLKQHAGEAFTDVTAHWRMPGTLHAEGRADLVNAEIITSNYFGLLGVSPVLGRGLFAAEDDFGNPERAAVISHALWNRRFNGDPSVLGRQIDLETGTHGARFTIVGVMPPGFKGISEPWKPTHVWVTLAQASGGSRTHFGVVVTARLRRDRTLEQARAVVSALGLEWYRRQPYAQSDYEPRFFVFRTNDVRMPYDPSAAIVPRRLAAALTVVVSLVLLVAAANIAGILMARAVGRSGEIAVRRVLGAGPSRILRQLLAESLALSLLGGLAAVPLVVWLLSLFRALTPGQFALEATLNGQVAAVSLAVCVLTGIIVGIMPARQALSLDVLPWLAGNGSVHTKPTRSTLRHAIMLPQVAVSLMLLLVAAVCVRGLLRIELADTGYSTSNLLVVDPVLRSRPGELPDRRGPDRPDMAERRAERSRLFYTQLHQRLRALAGGVETALAISLPLHETPERANWTVVSEDAYLKGERIGVGVERSSVSPGYFAVMQIPVFAGRDFDDRDVRSGPLVATVSRTLAQRLWPGGDAIGRRFALVNSWTPADRLEWYEVAGVVGDVSPILHERSPRPFVYLALGQEWQPVVGSVLVRASGDSRAAAPLAEAAINGADPLAEVRRVRTMSQMVAEMLYPRRMAATVLAGSGVIALFLATLGVYGVVSYSLAQRTGEIGIRMALGAGRVDIVRLLLREGWILSGIGSIAGLIAGLAAIRITSSRFLNLPEADIASLVLMPLVLSAVILLACYIPARRAARLDAMAVLRRL